MKPDIEYLQERFLHFNGLYFHGELPFPRIRVTDARSYMGNCRCKMRLRAGRRECYDFSINISAHLEQTEQQIEDTLLHEMIHLQVFSKGIKDSSPHGAFFRLRMSEINSGGRHISISHKPTEKERSGILKKKDEELKPHFICVATLKGGITGIAVCARTRIASISREIRLGYRVEKIEWHFSLDPYFDRFPRSLRGRLYKVPPEELREHISEVSRLDW